ncbi:bifunctional 2-polyprenyl-6-hydroxyphenol methylase/3-demethylubiquinol 3-O-methyltransferase UbiG [Geobacter sp. DSM 9736]|uniref:class I SAM-dependent methyltransferase n=1 Tax=Geobacter sp. DSM 9736 TaxID=1277350 RepID=UPI000B5091BB|nr:class I SAM-dependent methyltransferase [Geobacter sp. DSM 9736]SNB46595.1 2-polyprenyl-6-hydroxyphenyl methylase / 3-demethylubiquinone-9 3-methyltransferase [Geobacter sp. DSM 9736]
MLKDKDDKMFFYDRFADDFDSVMNMYDTDRRLDVIFRELIPEDLQGKLLLDGGSGTGWFSREASVRGAAVVSLDVGENILSKVAAKCDSHKVVGSVLDIPFKSGHFDYVISTEVIEHTPDPKRAVMELSRVVKSGGTLVITVPNRVWHPAIAIANVLKLRPYEGYENWVGWPQLKAWVEASGCSVISMKGIHLFPFVVPQLNPVLRWFDRYGQSLGPLMLNICLKASKK